MIDVNIASADEIDAVEPREDDEYGVVRHGEDCSGFDQLSQLDEAPGLPARLLG